MIRIGIVGVGRRGSLCHLPSVNAINEAMVVAICDIDEKQLNAVGDKYGIDEEHRFTDYNDLIACPDVDAVIVATSNWVHCDIAKAALKAGKPVDIEKPLGANYKQTLDLKAQLDQTPAPNMMCFSYRFRSAVRYAKDIIDSGMLGEIYSANIQYLQSGALIPGRRFEWRFDKEKTGTGTLADLGAHLIDMALLLMGDIDSVQAAMKTVVKQRKRLDSEEMADVLVDDYTTFIARFRNGAIGQFMVTKCAIGHGNTIIFDVYAQNGVLSFNLNDPDTLKVCIGKIDVETGSLHTVNVPPKYRVAEEQSFIDLLNGKKVDIMPTIEDGVRCQRVLEAVERSNAENRIVNIDEI